MHSSSQCCDISGMACRFNLPMESGQRGIDYSAKESPDLSLSRRPKIYFRRILLREKKTLDWPVALGESADSPPSHRRRRRNRSTSVTRCVADVLRKTHAYTRGETYVLAEAGTICRRCRRHPGQCEMHRGTKIRGRDAKVVGTLFRGDRIAIAALKLSRREGGSATTSGSRRRRREREKKKLGENRAERRNVSSSVSHAQLWHRFRLHAPFSGPYCFPPNHGIRIPDNAVFINVKNKLISMIFVSYRVSQNS